jgi:hypothetical protein
MRQKPEGSRFSKTTTEQTDQGAWELGCYIVDDVTRPNMVYRPTEYNLIILSHIVLANMAY